jgi:hypothetical protein
MDTTSLKNSPPSCHRNSSAESQEPCTRWTQGFRLKTPDHLGSVIEVEHVGERFANNRDRRRVRGNDLAYDFVSAMNCSFSQLT